MKSFTCRKGGDCQNCEVHVLANKVYAREKELREFPVKDDIIMTAYQEILYSRIVMHRKHFDCSRYNAIDNQQALIDHVINGDLPPQGIEVIPELYPNVHIDGQTPSHFCTRVIETPNQDSAR